MAQCMNQAPYALMLGTIRKIIMMEVTGKGRACILEGLTKA